MKTKLALALFISTSFAGAQDRAVDLLRKGILAEETNHDLDKAIEAYRSILKEFDEKRSTAATALFRLAECYRKQGKAGEASSAYQRVIREFSDLSKLAEQSRSQLAKTSGANQSLPAAASEQADQKKPAEEQRLDDLRMQLQQLEKRYTANHPEVLRVRAELGRSIESIINARVGNARQRYRSLLEDEIRLVEDQIKDEQRKIDTGVTDSDRITRLKRDVLTLKRALAAIDSGEGPLPLPTLPTRP